MQPVETVPETFKRGVFEINGVTYMVMVDEERERQQADLVTRKNAADSYIISLDSEESHIEAIAQCMKSFEFWCDNFCYTFDPRDKATPYKRFILFDGQKNVSREIIEAIEEGRNIHFDKSRDQGASWLITSIFTWMFLFKRSFHALVGSRVEDLVDNSTIDSLFGKIDMIIERLPVWMLNGYDKSYKYRKHLKIAHPCGNLITGESANKNFGRGPRKNVVYMDEFAFWENDWAAWTGASSTSPCCIATSTPDGLNNKFAEMKFSGEEMLHLSLHWTSHPFKTLEWYEKECCKHDARTVAKELDINYKASAGGLAIKHLQNPDKKKLIYIDDISPHHPSNTGARFFGGLDWGSTNPSSYHVYRVRAIAEDLYEVISMWEYYEPSSLPELAAAVKSCPFAQYVENIYADPSMWHFNQQNPQGVTSLAYLLRDEYAILLTSGQRGDTYALEQLNIMCETEIRFHICANCENQRREFEGLRYEVLSDRMVSKKNKSEKLVDKDNHSWDDFKYFYNTRFPKPRLILPPREVKTGYEALKEEFGKVKKKKLEALGKKPARRRLFRHY